MSALPALRGAALRLIGPCEVTAMLTGEVARVTIPSGGEFMVKQHSHRLLHEREIHAYRHWTRALGPSAPRLVAVDNDAMIIITSALPGMTASGDLTSSVHRQAGALLRRLHDAEPPIDLTWFSGWLQDRVGHWISRATTLLAAADVKIIKSHLEVLSRLGAPRGGPCHLDFQPRNWIISPSGGVSLVDFEHARIDLPARDLVRLRFRVWADRPDLRDAFLSGYGRPLSPAEDLLIWHLGALDTLTALARGHENADPALTAVGYATLRQLKEQPWVQ